MGNVTGDRSTSTGLAATLSARRRVVKSVVGNILDRSCCRILVRGSDVH